MSLTYASHERPLSCRLISRYTLPAIRLCSRLAPAIAMIWPLMYSLFVFANLSRAKYCSGVRWFDATSEDIYPTIAAATVADHALLCNLVQGRESNIALRISDGRRNRKKKQIGRRVTCLNRKPVNLGFGVVAPRDRSCFCFDFCHLSRKEKLGLNTAVRVCIGHRRQGMCRAIFMRSSALNIFLNCSTIEQNTARV